MAGEFIVAVLVVHREGAIAEADQRKLEGELVGFIRDRLDKFGKMGLMQFNWLEVDEENISADNVIRTTFPDKRE